MMTGVHVSVGLGTGVTVTVMGLLYDEHVPLLLHAFTLNIAVPPVTLSCDIVPDHMTPVNEYSVSLLYPGASSLNLYPVAPVADQENVRRSVGVTVFALFTEFASIKIGVIKASSLSSS